MKKFFPILLSILLLFMFVACGPNRTESDDENSVPDMSTEIESPNDAESDDKGEGEGDPEIPTEIESPFSDSVTAQNNNFYKDYPKEEKELYYLLWAEDTQVHVQVDITPHELAKLEEAFEDYENNGRHDTTKIDTYRKCNLTITVNGVDYIYEEVGIRMRGNTSRRKFCDADGNMYAFVHYRFSLSETFDGDEYEGDAWANELLHDWSEDSAGRKARKKRSFATMEKLYYKWFKTYDQTYVREIYANRMYRAYGILVPHITLTQFSITQAGNMESLGVGGLYETIDKQFIKRNFDKANKGGDLYKCVATSGKADLARVEGYGIETATQRFNYTLKTNDDPEDFNNHKHIIEFLTILQLPRAERFVTKLESMLDMDYFARFEAVNYLVGNPDCIRNNASNFYLYFTPEGQTYIIPYDYDRCFGINSDWNPSRDGMTSLKPYELKTNYGTITNPLYTKTILTGGMEKYQRMYQSRLREVLMGKWFTYENFMPLYEAYKATYDSLTMPSDHIVSGCGAYVKMNRFVFSEAGTNDYSSYVDNISMKDYITAKRRVAKLNIDKI